MRKKVRYISHEDKDGMKGKKGEEEKSGLIKRIFLCSSSCLSLSLSALSPPLYLRSEKGAGFEVSGQREAERGASSSV